MIITRISGGLGNQMFQYAIAKSLAKRNSDIVKLDISFYRLQTLRKYELNIFNIDENIATPKEYIDFRGKENFIFKLKRKGMPTLHGRGFGDLYVKVHVRTPINLSRKAKKILDDLNKELSS